MLWKTWVVAKGGCGLHCVVSVAGWWYVPAAPRRAQEQFGGFVPDKIRLFLDASLGRGPNF